MKLGCLDQEITTLEEKIENIWSEWSDFKKSIYLIMMNQFIKDCTKLCDAWDVANEKYSAKYYGLFSKYIKNMDESIVKNIRRDYYNNIAATSINWDFSPNEMINFGRIYRNGLNIENDEWRLKLLKANFSLMEKVDGFYESPLSIWPFTI